MKPVQPERYMDLPGNNPGGYDAANVLTYAPKLSRPLLVIHGTVDDTDASDLQMPTWLAYIAAHPLLTHATQT